MGRRECDAFGSYRIRIDGYRLKNGKLVLDARRLSVSQSLRQAGSKRVRAGRPGCARRIWWHVSGENTMDLVGVWQRIAVRHKDNTPPGIFRLAPGASDSEIDQFEAAIGLTLPPDVRESYSIHNGGLGHTCLLWYELLPLGSVLKWWQTYLEWQRKDGWGLGEDWKPFDVRGPIKPYWWTSKRIPLLDASGDHVMLDLDPAEDGNYGQIIDHCHEIGPQSLLAGNWLEWLNQLADDLEAGKYVYLEEEETVAPPGMYDV